MGKFRTGPRPVPGPAIRLDGWSMGKSRTGPRLVPGLAMRLDGGSMSDSPTVSFYRDDILSYHF